MHEIDYVDLLEVPYKLNGRDKTGLDCYGLVVEMFKRNGVTLPDYFYADSDDATITKLIVDNVEFAEELKRPEPYCAVLFKQHKFGTHMGVVLSDKRRFIHCAVGKNVSVEKLDGILWRDKIMGFYKWKILS